jgi:D-alanyl-lipoteichoic acid acyltransferase DltB (MBOAT superfamily)
MPFNSLPFILFFASFFFLYWRVFSRNLTARNLFILAGSYFFYAWWDWRFLFLLIANTALNYFLGLRLGKTKKESHRAFLLALGLIGGLGSLFFFKYYNFFASSLNDAAASFGLRPDMRVIQVILPLGISFYTFRTISYLLDIKRNKIEPVSDWLAFFCYVAFFPCLTAGPIDRAGTLVPQLQTKKPFDYDQAVDGMRQILWGLFKKLVIADNCALFTNGIFDQYKILPGSSLLFGALLFPIQLYADFSGYSDMAIGIASLLGFNVTRNFAYPFFAQNIVDYWRRWHMSLTTWLTDYVFTPLSIQFRDKGKWGVMMSVILTFTAIGIWHGANWTYVLYGFLNGCLYIPSILRGTINKREKPSQHGASFNARAFFSRIETFALVAFSLVIFRADNVSQAFGYYRRIFSRSIFSTPALTEKPYALAPLLFIALMLAAEWRQRDKRHALEIGFIKAFYIRAFIYFGLVGVILMFSATHHAEFIYFKF